MKIYERIIKFILSEKGIKKSALVDEPFKTVCFFSNTAIGDTLFSTPVFRVFKQNFPNVKVIAILNPSNADLFKNNPFLDEIVLFNGRWKNFLSVAKILKTKQIDIAFLLHSNEPQATPLAVLSGAKYIFKLPNLKNDFNKFHSNPPTPYGEPRYVVLNRLEQLKFVGINSFDTRMELFLQDSGFENVDRVLNRKKGEKIVGFQMGASVKSKLWLINRWQELAGLLLKHENIRIVLTGSPKERDMTKELEMLLNSDRVMNLAGKFSISEAAALIGRLDALITTDTGPLHVAAALKTPFVALFGVTDPRCLMPDFDTHLHRFLKVEFDVDNTYSKHKDYGYLMERITAQEVYESLKEIMGAI
ncbi:glycosyltransferase family 9 protein [Campylobacter sp. RM16187]|uniref:glycosyltransferase family 9 protein n=1 Tax=Campylobacter sp. RM16187 TaxID=1660063 RepID=UPI0021B50014|nr:glycosyltransferase family 9 protein [Campylobacter sp. RM16187]QKG29862.1 glycosyltransferase, family 9 [Campylobacter sp. RM16187]